MNPLLQRFLIAWAAGIAASGAVVGTAKRPHRLKRRRRRKKKDGATEAPVQIGAQALQDARRPADPGLSVEEWAAGMKALPSRVASIFSRVPKTSDDGAREPDEIRTASGEKVATPASPGKKKRRGRRRRQATLWESARESMKQTVREVVKDEVKDTPVGAAADAAKKAGDAAKVAGDRVKEGASVVAENAVKVGAQVGDKAKSLLNRILESVEANPAPNADPEAEALAEAEAAADAGSSTPTTPPTPEESSPEAARPSGAATAPVGASVGQGDPPTAAKPAVDVAEVATKVKSGLDAVGDWLSGPGAPGYKPRRARPSDGGDVVEAKDPEN